MHTRMSFNGLLSVLPPACIKNISNVSHILFPKYFTLHRSVFPCCQDLLVQECQETHHETGG